MMGANPNSICFKGLCVTAALLLTLQRVVAQDCACANCPQPLPDAQTQNFFVTVENAANPILGQNGQGLCGVRLHFTHAFIGDLIITLTAPSGQSVTLVGPVGYFGSTSQTTWNVTFVPCSQNATPDPGRSTIWSNAQNWGMFGNYTGTYHPFSGCLEAFNGTPVNGVWTVSVTDFQPVDDGEFLDFELLFCDTDGLSCFVCEAQAGNLPQDDIVWCEGSQVLNLNLPPAYAQGVAPAPVNRYDYAYVISDAQSGILLGISATPDLSAFLPGVYSICGLSYLKSHVARLPTPDSLFTVGRLRDTLATYPPMFCGDLTPDCVQVTIQNPVLIFESAVICESECYTFYGETYCQSGIYVRQTVAGECDIEATLNLTVLPARQTALSEVRCSGECATTPGFENVCTPGIYSLNLKTWQNCDSIVTLEMLSLSPVAQIQDHGLLDCTGATFLLDGSSSSAGADIAYQWTWLNGGNINGPSDAIQAEITSAGDYSLSVCQTASGLVCCDTAYTTVAVNGTPPLPPADVLAPALICSGQEVRLTAISSGNTDSFVWTIPAGSVLVGPPDSADVVLNLTTGGQVCVSAVNSCGISPPFCVNLNITQTPIADAGGDVQTCESSLILFAGPGAGQGVSMWEVLSAPGNGNIFLDNPGGAVTGVFADAPGDYRLIWKRDNFGCADADTMTLTIWEKPQWDDLLFLCDSSNEYYSAQINLTGGAMPYTVNGIDVNGAIYQLPWQPVGQPYALFLSNANGCAADSIPVLSHVCACTSYAGALGSDTLRVCENDSASPISLTPPLPDGNDVISYALCDSPVFSPAAILLHSPSDMFVFQPPLQTGVVYYLFRLIGNTAGAGLVDPDDICFSHSNPQPLIFFQNPAPQIAPLQAVCGLHTELTVQSNFPGVWSVVDGPGTLTIAAPAAAVTQASANIAGTYAIAWTASNDLCVAADTANFVFLPLPETLDAAFVCDSVNEYYTLNLTIQGVAPFIINGIDGAVSGSGFVSLPIVSGEAWAYQIADANGCVCEWSSGAHVCPCLTYAGQMSTLLQVFCAGEDAVVAPALSPTLDPNDVLLYVLHDQPGPSLGAILAVSPAPVFAYSPDYGLDVVYYVSAVAGSAISGTTLNFSDPCLSVSEGAPISWRALPFAYLQGDSAVCSGQELTLEFVATGIYPAIVQYQGASGIQTIVLNDGSPTQALIPLFSDAVFSLISVVDANGTGCAAALDQVLNIQAVQVADPGSPLQPVFSFCEKTDTVIALFALLDQAGTGGQWRPSADNPSIPPGGFDPLSGAVQVGLLTQGTYGFEYFFESSGPCPEVFASLALRIDATPEADAGPDQYLDCETNLATLSAAMPSASLDYAWYFAGALSGAQPILQTGQPGVYTLLVRNAAGCETIDSAQVIADYSLPQAEAVVSPIRCPDGRDGEIALTNISSNSPPVLVSLNGGAFRPLYAYKGLTAGDYRLVLQDAKGCEWEAPLVTLGNPPYLAEPLPAVYEVRLGEEALIQLTLNVGPGQIGQIVWTPLMDSSALNQSFQRYLPERSHYLRVTVTDTLGCAFESQTLVRVDRRRRVFIPNALMPGSAQNGRFTVFTDIGAVQVERMEIYDRWGSLLFERSDFAPNDPALGWNGMTRGQAAAPGVYVYQIRIRFAAGDTELFSGDLSVIR